MNLCSKPAVYALYGFIFLALALSFAATMDKVHVWLAVMQIFSGVAMFFLVQREYENV